MDRQPPAPSRDPRDAWRLVKEWLSACPTVGAEIMRRRYGDRHSWAEGVCRWGGAACICLVIGAAMATPAGIPHLHEDPALSVIAMAVVFVIADAMKRPASQRSQLVEIGTRVTAIAAVIAAIAEVHIAWQGRVLGFGLLLSASGHFAAKLRGMSHQAPQPIVPRMKWYLGVLAFELLATAIFAQAWSLTMPIRFSGDLAHPPVDGLPLAGVWFAAMCAIALVGWPATKRLFTGGLQQIGVDGKRPALVSHFVLTVAISGVGGSATFSTFGHPMLGFVLGLATGLALSGLWELLVYANVVLRGPGPVIWGLGLIPVVAGVRGAVIGPSQPHPGATEVSAAILMWIGMWIELRVMREVLGLKARSKPLRENTGVS
jgi:hypothetical protein